MVSVRAESISPLFLALIFFQSENTLQRAASRVQPLRAPVELDQELEEVAEVRLLVADLLSVPALELSGRLVAD